MIENFTQIFKIILNRLLCGFAQAFAYFVSLTNIGVTRKPKRKEKIKLFYKVFMI